MATTNEAMKEPLTEAQKEKLDRLRENIRSLGYKGDYIVMNNGVDMKRASANVSPCASVRTNCGGTTCCGS